MKVDIILSIYINTLEILGHSHNTAQVIGVFDIKSYMSHVFTRIKTKFCMQMLTNKLCGQKC